MINRNYIIRLLIIFFYIGVYLFLFKDLVYAVPTFSGQVKDVAGNYLPSKSFLESPEYLQLKWCYLNTGSGSYDCKIGFSANYVGPAVSPINSYWNWFTDYADWQPRWVFKDGFVGCMEANQSMTILPNTSYPGLFSPMVINFGDNVGEERRANDMTYWNPPSPSVSCVGPGKARLSWTDNVPAEGTTYWDNHWEINKIKSLKYHVKVNNGSDVVYENDVSDKSVDITFDPLNSLTWGVRTDGVFTLSDKGTDNLRDVNSSSLSIDGPTISCPPVDTTAPTCTTPTFTPSSTVSGPITATGTASDENGIAKTGIYVYQGNTEIKKIQDNDTPNTSTSVTKTWDLKNTAGNLVPNGDYQIHFNWQDPAGNVTQCQGNFKVDTTPPVCQTPVITPSGSITNSFSATGTATDNNGIKRTGIYIYKKSPNTHVREIQSNDTLNTNETVTTTWDLKDDAGNLVADGNYEIHYNWFDSAVGGLMTQCKADFTKSAIPPIASYVCSPGVTPPSFTFVPSQSRPLSVTVNSSVASNVSVLWADSCALGTFDLSNASSLSKSYSLVAGSNTLQIDWKSKGTFPNTCTNGLIQATITGVIPVASIPTCPSAVVTAGATNTYKWSGKAIWGDTDCPASASSSEWSSNPGLEGVIVSIGGESNTSSSDGSYAISKSTLDTSVTSFVSASKNGDYDFLCYKNGSTVKIKSGANWNKETFLAGDYNIIPYFKYEPPSFITANNGEVYSGFNIMLNKPSLTTPVYFQDTDSTSTLGGLVMAKGTIASSWGSNTTKNYSKQGVEGYELDLSLYLGKLLTELEKLKTTTDPVFKVPSQNVVYVKGDFSVTANDLISDYENQVIVVDGNVEITDDDNFGTDEIKTYILTTGSITFESTVNKPENILKFIGGVFANELHFDRYKTILNDKFKDPTIEFNLDVSLFTRDNLETVKVSDFTWREIL